MKSHLSRFGKFVWDRGVYAASFLLCALCLIAVAAMDKGALSAGNLVYLFVLCLFFIAAALVIDYVRAAPFLRRLERIVRDTDHSLDAVMTLPDGTSSERDLYRRTLLSQHKTYVDRLTAYRKNEDRRHLFTNQWVHQMKTPVSVIDLLLQQADEADMPEDAQRLLLSIREENERLAHGLDMVLHQARLEKFEGDLQPKRVDVRELIRTVINDHKKTLIRASIFPQVSGEQVWVETDEKWVLFVFAQIVSNAVKYSKIKDGNKKLSVEIEQDGGGCSVSISDEGIGIPPQDLDRVFHPYFTGENGRLTGESTGMGLYLAKEVCRRLGHGLEIRSEQGAGTTVTVHFETSGIHDVIRGR